MDNSKLIYEGKAKIIYESENKDEVLIYYKDSATAFNGEKKAVIREKGLMNNKISSYIFNVINKKCIPTHFVKQIDERTQICKKAEVIQLEFICRNIIAGSMSKRLGIEEGTQAKKTILEICYKNDDYNDPLINDYHAVVLGVITEEQLKKCYTYLVEINQILKQIFDQIGIILVDFKVEFGIDKNNNILLVDEISPDSCRLWDKETHEKLDKDVFRRDIGDITSAYKQIIDRFQI